MHCPKEIAIFPPYIETHDTGSLASSNSSWRSALHKHTHAKVLTRSPPKAFPSTGRSICVAERAEDATRAHRACGDESLATLSQVDCTYEAVPQVWRSCHGRPRRTPTAMLWVVRGICSERDSPQMAHANHHTR